MGLSLASQPVQQQDGREQLCSPPQGWQGVRERLQTAPSPCTQAANCTPKPSRSSPSTHISSSTLGHLPCGWGLLRKTSLGPGCQILSPMLSPWCFGEAPAETRNEEETLQGLTAGIPVSSWHYLLPPLVAHKPARANLPLMPSSEGVTGI